MRETTDSLLERKENYKEMKHGGCQVNGPKFAGNKKKKKKKRKMKRKKR